MLFFSIVYLCSALASCELETGVASWVEEQYHTKPEEREA